MLHLIGTGLWRADDISIRGMEICRNADKVYLDEYTRAFDNKEFERLQRFIGKPIAKLNRHELEEKLHFLDEAHGDDIALLVPGDPLIATTHITIVIEAKKKGIKFEIVHGSSIHAALIGEAGLHIYKFGGSCTIPMREKGIKPYSVYDKIAGNIERGLHTLVFLDTAPEREMGVEEAIQILRDIEREKNKGVCTNKTKIIVGCRLGSDEQRLIWDEIGSIINMQFKGPCTLIFPGELHFSEKEFLDIL